MTGDCGEIQESGGGIGVWLSGVPDFGVLARFDSKYRDELAKNTDYEDITVVGKCLGVVERSISSRGSHQHVVGLVDCRLVD